jgi:hypothetical protein
MKNTPFLKISFFSNFSLITIGMVIIGIIGSYYSPNPLGV